ncbi:MAG: NACHT domain-containing protein [Saprospiraceae bacterium]
MPSRKRLLLFLLIGFLTVAIGFIPDLVSEDLRPWCLQHFGPNYPWYMIGLFVVGCFVLLASSEFKDMLGFNQRAKTQGQIKIAWSQAVKQHLKSARETIKEAEQEETIKILSNLKNAVVDEQLSMLSVRLAQCRQDSRLGTITHEQKETALNRINKDILDLIKAIETQLSEGEKENQQLREAFRQRYRNRLSQKLASRQPVNLRRFATTEGTSEQVAATFIPYGSNQIGAEISKTFQDALGRLLIVGQPGAGKTTLLLQLADRLFDLEEDALPVVINLATWKSSFAKLETWLEAVLAAELSTNKAGTKSVLRQSNLILLLDGLDELRQKEAINSCLAAIADYGSVAGRRFVITCRIEEYKRVEENARVNLQIEVGPLDGEQLEDELTRMGREQPEALPLLQAIRKDPLLLQAAETPFYFNTLQLLFAGSLPAFTDGDLKSRKYEIKQKFVDEALYNAKNKTYLPLSAAHWLSFLASRMNQRNMVVFELRDLQYSWWHKWSHWNNIVATFMYRLVAGLAIGLVFALVFRLAFGLFYGLFGGQVGGLVILLGEGLVFGLIIGLSNGLIGGVVYGLVGGLSFYIETRDSVNWSIKGYLRLFKSFLVRWLVIGLVFGLIIGLANVLAYGLIIGLVIGLVIGLINGLTEMIDKESNDLIQITSPYHRFYASMKVFYFSILQHCHLRYLLFKKGILPYDLVDFLKEMSARNLLEFDGATWRFRHRIIQDYFAEQWVEPGEEK